ncbi:hypothetical protein SRABI128_06162 [Microbacterium sp. Bi128]|nr:hypothetical protein SRABI128_06162 [Microbacterium sp. Bi128]
MFDWLAMASQMSDRNDSNTPLPLHRAMVTWNSVFKSTHCWRSSSSDISRRISRRASRSSLLRRWAARPAAGTSTWGRASTRALAEYLPSLRSWATLSAMTNVPLPVWVAVSPNAVQERSASLTIVRLTPYCLASDASESRRVPTGILPPSIALRRDAKTASAAPTRTTRSCAAVQLSNRSIRRLWHLSHCPSRKSRICRDGGGLTRHVWPMGSGVF